MLQAGVSRCPGAPGVFGAVFRRQVSCPGGAGVVSKWCRLAPGSLEGAGWLQAPQKVQAGSKLPQMVQAGFTLPQMVQVGSRCLQGVGVPLGRCPVS